MNRFEMFAAMINRQDVTIGKVTGKIVRIELEDGSGHKFNVDICTYNNEIKTVFVYG